MLAEVFTFVLSRARGHSSGTNASSYDFAGWAAALERLASRPYDARVWSALDEVPARLVYDAAIQAGETLKLAQAIAETSRVGNAPMWKAYIATWSQAWTTLAVIANARQALGDTISQDDLSDIESHTGGLGIERNLNL